MSETGFCRYFKITTGKTFSTFLNEFRVEYACKLLISSSESESTRRNLKDCTSKKLPNKASLSSKLIFIQLYLLIPDFII